MGSVISYCYGTTIQLIHVATKNPDEDWNRVIYKWPLMSSPIPTILICMTFSYLAKVYGPYYMKNREPFKINGIKITYNVLMVIINLYMFIMYGNLGWWNGYSVKCAPIDRSPKSVEIGTICYIYFLTRFLDFVDTFFFVLSKKFGHITYLHLIHHSIMPFCSYMGMRIGPSGHGSFGAFINSFIHVIMYTYYFLSCLGPQIKPYLFWKKYLTALQLGQFFIINIHTLQLIWRPECDYPKEVVMVLGITVSLFTVLFLNFYIQSYHRKKNVSNVSKVSNGKPLLDLDANDNHVKSH